MTALHDRTVVVTALEANPTERRVAGGDPDAEPEVVPALLPLGREARETLADGGGSANGRELVVLDEGRIVEEGHQHVAREVLDRSLVGDNQPANGRLVLNARPPAPPRDRQPRRTR